MQTEWRDIPGFKGRYKISDRGDIYRYSFINRWNKFIGAGPQRTGPNRAGYYTTQLSHPDRGQATYLVHRLMLEAFIGPSDGRQGLHRNDIRDDNRLANLYWGSPKSNGQDRIRNRLTRRKAPNPQEPHP